MRKRALLILATALLVAAAGVVYAHWTETLTVGATVNTGNITTHWKTVYTDDDGKGNPNDGEPAPSLVYTHGLATSMDPKSAAGLSVGPGDPHNVLTAPTRYDKDVADCIAEIDSGDPHKFTLTVSNAYPSYHCTILSQLGNQGTVPVKVQAIRTTLKLDGQAFFPPGGTHPDYIATWETLAGHACGEQIDPGGFNTTIATLHFGQDLPQGPDAGNFEMTQEIELVNWNEWETGNCVYTFNTVPNLNWPILP